MRYSIFSVLREALRGQSGWTPVWREPTPKPRYEIVIVGGGGHGLATAYYLAKEHGIRDVAVIERSWLGSGSVGRNTTIVRSNYMLDGNVPFYETSLKLWEVLEREINYNAMVSQRGVLNLWHDEGQRDACLRRGTAMRLHGVDATWLEREDVRRMAPFLDFEHARFPILGGLLQPRGGTVRHDAVAWGYARAADALGVDLIQECEVTAIRRDGDRVTGVETTRGAIECGKLGLCAAGDSSRLAAMAGLRLPVETHVLQAYVTEGLKPFLDQVITFGGGHFYFSQSDKGGIVFGGAIDGYNSYARRGGLPMLTEVMREAASLCPPLSRARVLRSWGGAMDMSMDGSPIISKTPLPNLYLNAGWCIGGFKATPASGFAFAHTIARDEPHAINAPYRLDRFRDGATIDESGSGASPWLQ
ncbi:MAG: sarcosine oxidase subunit beta family protein [Hyphomicrobiales bacterium]|nr:sarcosine oxidase subunit beta family protein [Hyphomicrobiales bacterium]MDE2017124.1 sarcosine oxidase subunit beta family protein [Hyphomicrobiales bacterium]